MAGTYASEEVRRRIAQHRALIRRRSVFVIEPESIALRGKTRLNIDTLSVGTSSAIDAVPIRRSCENDASRACKFVSSASQRFHLFMTLLPLSGPFSDGTVVFADRTPLDKKLFCFGF